MQKNLLATNRKIVEGSFTGKAIGTKVCPAIWRFLVLIQIDMEVVWPLAEVVRTSFRLNHSNIPSDKIKFTSDKYSFIACCLLKKTEDNWI